MAAILLDVDGVLHVSGEPIRGAAEAVARLREAGHRLRFVTNSTTRSRGALADDLRGFGIDLEDDELQTTTASAARALAGKRVLALMMSALVEDLADDAVGLARGVLRIVHEQPLRALPKLGVLRTGLVGEGLHLERAESLLTCPQLLLRLSVRAHLADGMVVLGTEPLAERRPPAPLPQQHQRNQHDNCHAGDDCENDPFG
jgi:hypothetical protein